MKPNPVYYLKSAIPMAQKGCDGTPSQQFPPEGHKSVSTTDVYLHADLQMKERALAKTTLPNLKSGRYKPDDEVLEFLNSL